MPAAFSKAHGNMVADFALGQRHPKVVEAVELGGIRTALAAPLVKDDEPIGVIAIHRPEVANVPSK
jgi:GAF domain-containing protein